MAFNLESKNEGNERKVDFLKINTKLLPYKSFYFFFFSAAGSVFPYLALFYKQQWLSAQQTGILIGIRPLLHTVSNTVWGIIADTFNKTKLVFLMAIAAWLCSIFSLSLAGKPAIDDCCFENLKKNNNTEISKNGNRTIKQTYCLLPISNETELRRKHTNNDGNEEGNRRLRRSSGKPLLKLESHRSVYPHDNHVYFILLTITVVGTLLCAPALPFADTATLQILGEDKDFYGKQRQWGALGWGVSSFVVGAYVSTMEKTSHCIMGNTVDYHPCFYAYGMLMAFTIIPALFFSFDDKSTNFAQNFVDKAKTLLSLNCVSFLLTILMFGCSWGLMQTFLLWHLRDLGGTQFLFSLIAATQCISELVTFNFAGHLIKITGHYRLLYLSLLYSSLRFTLYGVIKNPWFVLPIEVFHGVSTTLVWSVAVSFVSIKAGLAATMQSILTGIHWGLGLGGGSILCGVLVHRIGTNNTFFAFGIIPVINLVVLIIIKNVSGCLKEPKQSGASYSLLKDPHDDNEALNPLRGRASRLGICCGLNI